MNIKLRHKFVLVYSIKINVYAPYAYIHNIRNLGVMLKVLLFCGYHTLLSPLANIILYTTNYKLVQGCNLQSYEGKVHVL